MKRVTYAALLVLLTLFLLQCGGTKKLTPEEMASLSPQEKVTHLEKVVEKNPNDIESRKELYKTYLEMGMEDQAIRVMKEIMNIDPYQADVNFDYGQLMMKRGEEQLAYKAFRDALNSPGGSAYTEQIAQYLGGKYLIQQITNTPANEAFPSFSPDGKKLVYQTDVNGNWDIVERDLESGEETFLVNSPADEELPSYSPDGKEIVYTSNQDDHRPIDRKFKVREIYLKKLDSGYEYNLTESIADDWLPRFSPDGSHILFVSDRSDLRQVPYTEKQSDIYVMESNGDFHLQLTNNDSNEGGACYTVDGKRILFHSNRNGSYDIFVMKADGSMPMTVLGEDDVDEVNPCVSPDSVHFVFFSNKGGNYDIYQAKLDGSEVERLTYSPAKDTDPVYSPDGQFVAFHSDRNGNYDIFILNLNVTSQPTASDLIKQLDMLIQN